MGRKTKIKIDGETNRITDGDTVGRSNGQRDRQTIGLIRQTDG